MSNSSSYLIKHPKERILLNYTLLCTIYETNNPDRIERSQIMQHLHFCYLGTLVIIEHLVSVLSINFPN